MPDRAGRSFLVERQEVLVVRVGDQLFAYENRCPHRGTTLDWVPDRFMTMDAKYLQCATHGALFRPEDGVCVLGPCQGQALQPLRIERVDADVWLVR